jgi:hypothetical protein
MCHALQICAMDIGLLSAHTRSGVPYMLYNDPNENMA